MVTAKNINQFINKFNYAYKNNFAQKAAKATFKNALDIFNKTEGATKWTPYQDCETRFKNIKNIFFERDDIGEVVKTVVKKDGTVLKGIPRSLYDWGRLDIIRKSGKNIHITTMPKNSDSKIIRRYTYLSNNGNQVGYRYEPYYLKNIGQKEKEQYVDIPSMGIEHESTPKVQKDFENLKEYFLFGKH